MNLALNGGEKISVTGIILINHLTAVCTERPIDHRSRTFSWLANVESKEIPAQI